MKLNILLINPNSSAATTARMAAVAQHTFTKFADRKIAVSGLTVAGGPQIILTACELSSAGMRMRYDPAILEAGVKADGIIVAAFGDPALDWISSTFFVPCIGIGQASIRAAAKSQRRFGIATTTPQLKASIEQQVRKAGLWAQFSGVRITASEPWALALDPQAQQYELAVAAKQCFAQDGAEAVIIGGGPLGDAASAIQAQFHGRVINPIEAASEWMAEALCCNRAASVLLGGKE